MKELGNQGRQGPCQPNETAASGGQCRASPEPSRGALSQPRCDPPRDPDVCLVPIYFKTGTPSRGVADLGGSPLSRAGWVAIPYGVGPHIAQRQLSSTERFGLDLQRHHLPTLKAPQRQSVQAMLVYAGVQSLNLPYR